MNSIMRSDDEILFDRTMQSLEAQITSAGAHLTIDSKARLTYTIEIKRMSNRLRADAVSRRITWADAARQAQETRNLIMEVIRARSTPVGRALAQRSRNDSDFLCGTRRAFSSTGALHLPDRHGGEKGGSV